MKITMLTTILSAAALSAALFASPASAQSCTCQRTVAPRVIVTAPPVTEYYGDDQDFYSYDETPQVVITYPYGFWDGGWYAGRYFERGYWYGHRRYDREVRGGERWDYRNGERGIYRGGERWDYRGGERGVYRGGERGGIRHR
ncbi:MAG: hypothetical protein P4L53_04395 [Candidatus Obscuribacterales bacterium]|nr:hypothetical protein [Candidatus Obscuribacterales bacterium]